MRINSNCPNCGNGNCYCVKCRICGKYQKKALSCLRCSACRSHHEVYFGQDFPVRKCTYKNCLDDKTFYLLPLKRWIGVELEMTNFGHLKNIVENTRQGYQYLKYRTVHDGSVNVTGKEINSDRMIGDEALLGLVELSMYAQTGSVDKSCGYHVHIDAADFSALDIRNSIIAFTRIQNDLFGTLVKQHRNGNEYCQKLDPKFATELEDICTSNKEFADFIHNILYKVYIPNKDQYSPLEYRRLLKDLNDNLKRLKGTKYVNEARRWALNIHSWMMRGTLEFRLKEGTNIPGDLIMWPIWCGYFVNYIKEAGNDSIKQIKLKTSIKDVSKIIEVPDYVMDWVDSKC